MGKTYLKWVEYLIIFSFLSISYCSGLKSAVFQPDESQWIATSFVYEDYFSGNFTSPSWDLSYWTLTQPPLPRYLIGMGRRIGGLSMVDLNQPWHWQEDYPTNIAEGRLPSEQLLWWSRLPMGMLAALSIFIGFYFLNKFQGRLPAYVWVLLCTVSAYFREMLSRAMGEAPLLACIAGIMFILYRLLQRSKNEELENPERFYVDFLFFGIAVGFAQSSKLNGLSAIGAGFVIAFIIAFKLRRSATLKIRFGLTSTLILILSSQLIFLMLNPFLWKDPLVRTAGMFYNRAFEMQNQQILYPESKITGFQDQIIIVTQRIFQSYSAIHFDGVYWINFIFFLVGLSFLVLNAAKYLQQSNSNSAGVAILLVGSATSIPSLFTPLDWDRYYLLPVYFSTLAISVGIWRSGQFGYRLLRNHVSWH